MYKNLKVFYIINNSLNNIWRIDRLVENICIYII